MAAPGMISKSIPIVVAASLLLSCNKAPNNPNNDLNPGWELVASVFPDIGTTSTEFTFTAFAILDSDTVSTDGGCQARWDWDNDGTWDTGWLDSLTAAHTYGSLGKQIVKLAVRDSAGYVDSTTYRAFVQKLIQITYNESRSGQGNIDWSRDGTDRIAFDWRGPEGGGHQIWVVAYPDGDPDQVTFDPDPENYNFHQYPEWSPDGKKIAFWNDKGIGLLDLNTDQVNQLLDQVNGFLPCWSPDGRWLLFSNGQINIYDFENQSSAAFVSFGNIRYCFSPAGDRVAISDWYEDATLSIVDFQTRNVIREHKIPICGVKLDWSPNGKWISLGIGSRSNTVYLLNDESGKIFSASFDPFFQSSFVSWSADGLLLAFDARKEDGYPAEIWAITFPADME